MTFLYEHSPENLSTFTFDKNNKAETGSRQEEANVFCEGYQAMPQDGSKLNSEQVFFVDKKNSCMAGLVNGIAFSTVVWVGIALLI